MVEVVFLYNNQNIIIQSNLNEKMENIFEKFLIKSLADKNSINYLYKQKTINAELEVDNIIDNDDKQKNKMNIIVNKKNEENNILVKSKNIICPKCGENCLFDLENYEISLFNCKNGHDKNVLFLDKFEETQYIDMSKIICDNCKESIKSNNNKLFICLSCKMNLCSICKSQHDKSHTYINYDQKDNICPIHNESYMNYCNECKINICILCNNEHKSHKNTFYNDLLPDMNVMKNKMEKFRKSLDSLKENIKDIIKKLNKVADNIEIYYRTFDNLLNSYQNKNRYYELLKNIYQINKIDIITKDLEQINSDKSITNKSNNILNIYFKMVENNTKIYDNGDKYVGEIKNGVKEGKGIMYYSNGDKYEGEFKNDLKEGKGILYRKNGSKYEGDFKNDKKDGKGILFYNDGDKFEGNYKNDKREGKGIYYYASGNRYEGEYKDGKKEGKGIYFYNVGSLKGDKYEGDWKEDKKEGKGIYYSHNGDRYEGDFKDNKKEGKGILYFNNNDRQMGDYKNDNCVGNHALLSANGKVKVKKF